MAPRGAVDAVGSTLVQKLGSFGFQKAAAGVAAAVPSEQRNARGGVTRDI